MIQGQVTVGLAGGSGAGKSTIAALLVEDLKPLTVQVIGLDRFFRPAAELPTYFSSLHGEGQPDYNRPDSLFEEEMVRICSVPAEADVVILDGHMSLHYQRLRAIMDVKCFVDAEIEDMMTRRTKRNLEAGYGGDLDTILHYNRECVLPGYQRYIEPSRAHADVVIDNRGDATDRALGIEDACNRIREAADR
ncbi:MAG: hypothetical protein HN712_30150 [Gemmatimonadetes bacterium]|jgi:uridine kinase|nr:hypothetical protein [Gemmatimonadota bacterium]MBT7864606.1 hypothetical protein [Gemmatimonadota bacterium]